MEDFNSKYTGEQVETLLDIVSQGGGGEGGGGITVETDPVFSASPAASITEAKKEEWDAKQDAIEDLDAIRAGAAKGTTALQEEQYKGTVTGVTFYGKDYTPDSDGKVYMGYPDVGAVKEITINGSTKTPANGVVDLGTVLTQHQDISQKADLSNGKILASQLPDYILGQVMYGGVINSGDSSNINVQTSINYQNKYNVSQTATINKYQFWGQTGVYFISGANGTFFDIEVKVGDWLISTGSSVAKVDNTDAVSSVAGLTGVIDASALGKELSYNDLKDKPTIPSAVTESTVSGWGFTKNTGTLTGVAINGTTINASNGVVYIPNASMGSYGTTKLNSSTNSTSTLEAATPSAVKAAYDLANDKQDKLVSGSNIKTINGQSIVGSGNLIIEGGSGGVAPYITDFTILDLASAAYNDEVYRFQFNNKALEEALRNRVPIYVPIDPDASYEGYGVLQGYTEDLLYFTVITSSDIFSVEVSRSTDEIDSTNITYKGRLLTSESGVCKQQVGDFIVAETNALFDGNSVYALPTSANGDEDDILLSVNTVKTINGQSLVGEGDITISGGSGGGNSAYPEVHHGTSDTTFTLTPNTFHVWDEVGYLDLIFGDPIEGMVNEYIFQFSSPHSKATTLWIPGGVLWPVGGDLIIESGKTYIISVVNKFGVFVEYVLPLLGTDPA